MPKLSARAKDLQSLPNLHPQTANARANFQGEAGQGRGSELEKEKYILQPSSSAAYGNAISESGIYQKDIRIKTKKTVEDRLGLPPKPKKAGQPNADLAQF